MCLVDKIFSFMVNYNKKYFEIQSINLKKYSDRI